MGYTGTAPSRALLIPTLQDGAEQDTPPVAVGAVTAGG